MGYVLVAGLLAIAVHRVAQAIIDGLRVKKCLDKGRAVPDREIETLMLLDGPAGRSDALRTNPDAGFSRAAARSMRFFWSRVMRVSRCALRTRPLGEDVAD